MTAKTYTEYALRVKLAGVTPMSEADWNARNAARPQATPVMVLCDCGHTVAKSLAMSASTGTSCPDCYDRMSE